MINIFFNIDDTYKRQCRAVIRSILAHTKEDITFHIVGVNSIDFEGIRAAYYKSPDISMLKFTNQMGHITMTATYRIFAPFLFKNIDKIIYLDCDLIVLDDIAELWEYEPKYIAGVKDGLFKRQARKNRLKHAYINSGVMILNLKNLRKLNYLERIENTQNGCYNLSLLDQDIINIAFENEIEHLPAKWNVYSKIYSEADYDMIEARQKPSILHWCGYEKPWNSEVWNGEEWSKYDD